MNEIVLIVASLLIIIAVLVSKISDRFGIPVLLLFLLLGMLAGSDGLGGIYFDDPLLAQRIGVYALAIILFSGGLDTNWQQVRPVLKEGLILSTIGVFVSALVLGIFVSWLLKMDILAGLLLGSIVSSTDAAAVFSILRTRGVSLKARLKPLLELESGSNDPMAIFLTIGLIQIITSPGVTATDILLLFFQQMLVGAVLGLFLGRLMVLLANRLRSVHDGLYPVLILAMVFFTFSTTSALGGSGFLAVYVAGIVLGNHEFIHRRSIQRFHDGLAWLMQMVMFITLGLLVFPSRLPGVAGVSLLIAIILILIARPVSVFLGLMTSQFHMREKLLISWVGLRGATPIVLATFPLIAGIPQAGMIFNVVFFVVLTSVLLQGTSIPLVARWLHLDVEETPKKVYPLEYKPVEGFKSELKELHIPSGSPLAGKAIVEVGLPPSFLVILIARDNDFLQPSGATVILPDDTLLVLADREIFDQVAKKALPENTASTK